MSYRSGCLVNHSSLLELQVFLHGNNLSQQLPKERGGGGQVVSMGGGGAQTGLLSGSVKICCLFCVEIGYLN